MTDELERMVMRLDEGVSCEAFVSVRRSKERKVSIFRVMSRRRSDRLPLPPPRKLLIDRTSDKERGLTQLRSGVPLRELVVSEEPALQSEEGFGGYEREGIEQQSMPFPSCPEPRMTTVADRAEASPFSPCSCCSSKKCREDCLGTRGTPPAVGR